MLNFRKQHGYSLPTLAIVLAVMSIIQLGVSRSNIAASARAEGKAIGGGAHTLSQALGAYQNHYRTSLTQTPAAPIPLPSGGTVANPLQPTLSELAELRFLTTTFTGFAPHGGSYLYQIEQVPSGCTPSTCNLASRVWTSTAVTNPETGNVDIRRLGAAASEAGSAAGYSTLDAPGTINGTGGWSAPNPVGNVPGILMVINGVGAPGIDLSEYFKRDGSTPLTGDADGGGFSWSNLLNVSATGNVSAGGNVTSIGQITGSGDIGTRQETSADPVGAGNCLRAVMRNDGQIISRDAGCVDRAYMNPQTARSGVRDVTGSTERAHMDGNTGRITAERLLATIQAVPGSVCSASEEGDIVRDSTTVAPASGESSGLLICRNLRYVVVGSVARGSTEGAACTEEGGFARDLGAGADGVLLCRNGVYNVVGLPTRAVGDMCTQSGRLAQTSAKLGLICRGGAYVSLTDRMPFQVFMDSFAVTDGTSVPKPSCGVDGTPLIYVIPQTFEAAGYVNFYANNGGTWIVRITDGLGASISGSGLVQTVCHYTS
jgi:type II secretory pathway pseudopilin PulG